MRKIIICGLVTRLNGEEKGANFMRMSTNAGALAVLSFAVYDLYGIYCIESDMDTYSHRFTTLSHRTNRICQEPLVYIEILNTASLAW